MNKTWLGLWSTLLRCCITENTSTLSDQIENSAVTHLCQGDDKMYKPYKESKSICARLSVWRIMTSSIAHTLCFSHSSVRVSFLSNTNSDILLRVNYDNWIYSNRDYTDCRTKCLFVVCSDTSPENIIQAFGRMSNWDAFQMLIHHKNMANCLLRSLDLLCQLLLVSVRPKGS